MKGAVVYAELLGGADIRADHLEGYERPLDIEGRRPDVTAVVQGEFWAIECERCDALDDVETAEQVAELYNAVTASGGRFALYVPLDCHLRAQFWLRGLGLPPERIVIFPPQTGTGKFSGER